MRNVLTVNGVVRRFGETQIVDGVQDVGLALPVEPYETIQFIREMQTRLSDILVVQYVQFAEKHRFFRVDKLIVYRSSEFRD